MKKLAFLAILAIFSTVFAANTTKNKDQTPQEYLETQFPKLFNEYRNEVSDAKAHYIFAIDVSGTMIRFKDYVVPSLKAFFGALPDGDMVTVLPFGTEVLNLPGYSGTVNTSMKKNLMLRADDLYTNSNLTREFKAHTDIKKVMDAVSAELRNNHDYKINIVVILTDFRNDVPNDNERKLNSGEIESLYTGFTAASKGLYIKNIALELPYMDKQGNMSSEKNLIQKGYCLDQLQKDVFPRDGDGKLQRVPVDNSPEAINHWFTQLQRDIMVTKLKGVISNENRVEPAEVVSTIDIDGNVNVVVNWTPARLYPSLKVDSSYFEKPEWNFINEKESWQTTQDRSIELELGQIKNAQWGLHNGTDSLKMGLSLPTPYDDELERLEIVKPLPDTKAPVNRWLFTFFLPFWLSCVIVAAILLYILLFFKAIARNAGFKLSCKYVISENESGESKQKTVMDKKAFEISEGAWSIKIQKKNGNPFALFAEPYFEWSASKGFAGTKFGNSGKLDYKANTSARIPAGTKPKEITHTVRITMIGK